MTNGKHHSIVLIRNFSAANFFYDQRLKLSVFTPDGKIFGRFLALR